MFITLEGPEGGGKTTQREFIAEWLRKGGYEVVITREPGGTPLAEEIRALMLSPRDEVVDGMTELQLVFAARNQHVKQVIQPALEAGKVVICDRFVDSTMAYQGYGRRMMLSNIQLLEEITLGDFKPDMTFLLDLPSEVGMARAAARGKLDRLELEGQAFFARVRNGFLTIADQNPDRVKVIDATQPIEQVQAQIIPHLLNLVNRHKQRPDIKDNLHGNEDRAAK